MCANETPACVAEKKRATFYDVGDVANDDVRARVATYTARYAILFSATALAWAASVSPSNNVVDSSPSICHGLRGSALRMTATVCGNICTRACTWFWPTLVDEYDAVNRLS